MNDGTMGNISEENLKKIKDIVLRDADGITHIGVNGYDIQGLSDAAWQKEIRRLQDKGVRISCLICNLRTAMLFTKSRNITIDNTLRDNIVYINHKW